MWVASSDGSDVVAPLPELHSEGENRRALVPVRFSADNSTLYYTLQPVGIGGTWNAFAGRYDNLYALRLNTDADPVLIFDCADDRIVLCIGDFYEVEGQVANLAYVNRQAVVIMNGLGEVINTISLDEDYVGYPTFGPGADLICFICEICGLFSEKFSRETYYIILYQSSLQLAVVLHRRWRKVEFSL